MSNDQVTVTTTQSYGSRIKDALAGIIIGPVLVFFACLTLWNNEGRNADMQSAIREGQSSVQLAQPDAVDPTLDGKLVHLTGKIETDEALSDTQFGLTFSGIRLMRTVEMYQWDEKSDATSSDKLGGSQTTTTTYTYAKVWDDTPIDSSMFHEKTGHENPATWKYSSTDSIVEGANIGKYTLSTPLIEQIPVTTTLPLSRYTPSLHTGETIVGDAIYVSADPQNPQIGDLRISYNTVENNYLASILAKQSGNMLSSYIAKSGSDITRIESGTKTATEMFQHATEENTLITWIWRIGGLVFIFVGFLLFFRILPILAKVIPPLAWIVDTGVGLIALLLTVVLGGGIIIIAWFAARPIVSLIVLAVCLAIGAGIYYYLHTRKNPIPTPPTI